MLGQAFQNHLESIQLQNETSELIEEKIEELNKVTELVNKAKDKEDIDALFKYLGTQSERLIDFRQAIANINYKIDTASLSTRKIGRYMAGVEEEKRADKTHMYLMFASFVVVFGVFTSLYRFHIREASKFEQYHLGFIRIKVAAADSKTGLDNLVKESLTKDAFTSMSGKKVLKVLYRVTQHPILPQAY
ncbi:hypothetical protein HMI54_012138 [Coelomomyces lativittatus]|nr:hypothetical protein HMI54_012138 [Coelomomyces lativittatus]